MALTLKRYQREALAALTRFFALARGARDEAALDAAFRQTLLEQEHAAETIPPYLAQGFVNDEGATPYVCVRIPTGGGKTLLGAHALAAAARHYTGQDRPLALWLVPTNVIRQQTLSALKTPGHPYREALEAHFGVDGVRVLDIADSDQIRPQDIGARALVIVGTLQTLRVDDTSGRDVYAYKEDFEPHFERAPELPGFERVSERDLEVQPYLGRADLGKVKRSFANLMYWHRPVVIIDEAHNARTPLSYDSFARLRPAALIEMTATPVRQGRHRSNVLYHVSAEELKAEEMIKLPIVLSAHPNWEEAVRDALLTRTRLAEEAARELAAGGDYLRPILLLQAEDKRGEMNVERLREHLIAQENIAPERIAVATGTQRDLDGVNLFDPACPVEVVITVEALKEGWDCSFAYVFCSLQNVGSSRDMEQLLGRVLRMPYAKRRRSELLNRAYAHLASAQSTRVAGELADRLVAMGFEELEAVQAVFPTSLPLWGDTGAEGEPSAPALPALELVLPAAAAAELFALDTGAGTPALRIETRPNGELRVSLDQPPPPELRAALVAAIPERKARDALTRELDRFELRHRTFASPSQLGVAFRPLPLLCVRDAQGELELAERETLLDLAGFVLADQPPELPGFRPDESPGAYLVDLDHGHLRIEQERAAYAVNLDLVPTTVTEADLLHWLDARLREPGTPQPQTARLAGSRAALAGALRRPHADRPGAPPQPARRRARRTPARAARERAAPGPAARAERLRDARLHQRGVRLRVRARAVSGAPAVLHRPPPLREALLRGDRRSAGGGGAPDRPRVSLRGRARRSAAAAALGAQPGALSGVLVLAADRERPLLSRLRRRTGGWSPAGGRVQGRGLQERGRRDREAARGRAVGAPERQPVPARSRAGRAGAWRGRAAARLRRRCCDRGACPGGCVGRHRLRRWRGTCRQRGYGGVGV
jgi:type III restriction enzyme